MECWAKSTSSDRRLFQIIAGLVGRGSSLLVFLFDAEAPRLRLPADELIKKHKACVVGTSCLLNWP